MIKDRIEQDLKTALLAGDKTTAEVLRGLKSSLLYEAVAQKKRDTGLSDDETLAVLAREAKKRAESADIYRKAGSNERAEAELAEKAVIDKYLPAQLTDDELAAAVDQAIAALGPAPQLGQVIGAVKAKVGSQADGGRIAAMVKARLGA